MAIGLALGATRSLLWVLLADHIGVRFFATVGIAVSSLGGVLGAVSFQLVMNSVGWEESGAEVVTRYAPEERPKGRRKEKRLVPTD